MKTNIELLFERFQVFWHNVHRLHVAIWRFGYAPFLEIPDDPVPDDEEIPF